MLASMIDENMDRPGSMTINFGPTRSNMKSKHMTIGMQNKLQNKNRKKGCPIDRRTIKKQTHV
jgi:hypothetical protein